MTDEPTGLLAAMLAVQAEAPTLLKDNKATVKSDKGTYTYTYIGLDTVVEKVGPLLHKNSLVWSTRPSYIEGVGPSLKYKLAHAPTREAEEGEMLLLLPKNDPQGQGSAITYARRYALCAVLNLVADDDDDGKSASGGHADLTGGSKASGKQLKFLRTLATKARVQPGELANLMRAAGADVPAEYADLRPFVDALTPRQASSVIDTLQEGPVRTGESDVPADGSGFTHEPAGEDDLTPEVPS